MLSFLDKIPYPILIVFSVIMILIPFRPMPHFMEKLIMSKSRVVFYSTWGRFWCGHVYQKMHLKWNMLIRKWVWKNI